MTVLSFIFLICSIRVNIVFVLQILAITVSYGLISAGLFYESTGIRLLGEALSMVDADPVGADVIVKKGLATIAFTRKLVYVSSRTILVEK